MWWSSSRQVAAWAWACCQAHLDSQKRDPNRARKSERSERTEAIKDSDPGGHRLHRPLSGSLCAEPGTQGYRIQSWPDASWRTAKGSRAVDRGSQRTTRRAQGQESGTWSLITQPLCRCACGTPLRYLRVMRIATSSSRRFRSSRT